jgi:voltage-gated hydrogen channel 1
LLIVFRLWRIIKIMEAVAMGVSISETSSVDNVVAQLNKERQRRQELEQLLEQECAKREALEQENEKLKGNVV